MFQSEGLRDRLIKQSDWVPPSFSVSKFDMEALVSQALLQLSKTLPAGETWDRVRNDIILFDELNNTKDKILIDILSDVFLTIVKNQCSNPNTMKKKIMKCKCTLNNLLRSSNIDELGWIVVYRARFKIFISGSEIGHRLGSREDVEQKTQDLEFGAEMWMPENIHSHFLQLTPYTGSLSSDTWYNKTSDPTISGLRLARISTEVITRILNSLRLNKLIDDPDRIICVCDGSGGRDLLV